MNNAVDIAEGLAKEIREKESLHSSLLKDLAELASSPAVSEEEFNESFMRVLARSGLESRIQNAVFHLLRNRGDNEDCFKANGFLTKQKDGLAYMIKIQQQWERRIVKSLNSMSSELGLSLAKPRCQDEQEEFLTKWNELSGLDVDVSLFRPVYAPKDFLEILSQISSPNLSETSFGKPWGIISVPLAVPKLQELRDKFVEISKVEPHLGLNPHAPSVDDPLITLETERFILGQKVINANHAPLSQEFLKRGSPSSLRGKLWAQVLGTYDVTSDDRDHFEWLKCAVLKNDVMIDKLIIKDVQLTSANDDNYFVFEDVILQVLLSFSRDTDVLRECLISHATPAKAILRGRSHTLENSVSYPPNGIVPFHGFSMYCAPFCYVYSDTCQLYHTFRAFYQRFCYKLHEISSDNQGIVSLCCLFENLVREYEPELWSHLQKFNVQPLRLVFRWIMRAFSGHLPPDQLLLLWDLILAYDSLEVLPLLSATILSFRKENLLRANTVHNIEAVLADISSVPVIPLLQLALQRQKESFQTMAFAKTSNKTSSFGFK